MRKGSAVRLAGFALLLLMAGAENARAAITTYYGCYNCQYVHLTGTAEECRPAGVLQGGEGWTCYEDNSLPWPAGPSCWTNGQACTNGGTGGGTGSASGGGSDPCATTTFCPAQCFSCSGGGGRPAV